MIFYKIINKKTHDKLEVNKVFFSGVYAQRYADTLNNLQMTDGYYEPYPIINILSKEEKEMYSGLIKRRKFQRKFSQESQGLN